MIEEEQQKEEDECTSNVKLEICSKGSKDRQWRFFNIKREILNFDPIWSPVHQSLKQAIPGPVDYRVYIVSGSQAATERDTHTTTDTQTAKQQQRFVEEIREAKKRETTLKRGKRD